MTVYKDNFNGFFYWFAWTIACLASLFFLFFVVVDGFSNILAGRESDLLVVLPGLILAIAGCITSFFKKVLGGSFMLIGGIALIVAIFFQGAAPDYRMMIVYGFPYVFPGIVFLFVRK